MSQATQDLKQKLRQRKEEIEKELYQVEAALSAFKETRPAPADRKSGRRKKQPVDVGKVLKIVNDSPGLKASEVARRVGIPRSSSYRALGKLKSSNEVVKYGTRWYPSQKIERGLGGSSAHL